MDYAVGVQVCQGNEETSHVAGYAVYIEIGHAQKFLK